MIDEETVKRTKTETMSRLLQEHAAGKGSGQARRPLDSGNMRGILGGDGEPRSSAPALKEAFQRSGSRKHFRGGPAPAEEGVRLD